MVFQIISYQLSQDEIWSVWPQDEGITSFVSRTAPQVLPDIVKGYFNVLRREMSSLMADLGILQQNFVNTFELLNEALQDYEQSTRTDHDFVM